MKKWSEKEINWLKDNYSIIGTNCCVSELNRSRSSILGMATKLGLKAIKPGAFSKNEIKFLLENYPKQGVEYCATNLGRTKGSIHKQTHVLGLKTNIGVKERNNSNKRRLNNYQKYDVTNILNISNKYVAYILGYLWADGHIIQNNSFLTSINLVKEDAEFLYGILNSINGGWTIGKEIKKYWKNSRGEIKRAQNQRTVRIYSQELFHFLKENDYGVKSIKSFKKIWSIMPQKYKSFFILGLFDGDGHFNYQFRKNKYHSGEFVITASYDYDWTVLEDYFRKNNIEFSLYRDVVKLGKVSRIIVRKKESLYKLYVLLYSDDNFKGLERKYNKYLKYIRNVN